ncbi:MAG: N-acetylmuramoyl-L-alanine amidase [Acidiferrobacterales bacterium]
MSAWAGAVSIENLRMWPAPDYTRLVFDLSGPLEYRLFMLKDPERVVVDLDNARLSKPLPSLDTGSAIIAGMRSGERGANSVRIVIDLKAEAQPRTFMLKPAGEYGDRLVIDLYDVKAAQERAKLEAHPVPRNSQDLVVAIDAGHGGDDPGATGRLYHTREKDVVLAIARDLDRLVSGQPGMKAIMTRTGDYYVPLAERTRLARGADVFISIHADSMPGRHGRAHGASVYALSEKGATSALARALAKDENASDWIGGVSLNNVDDDVGKVLGDLTKSATISDSLELGDDMLLALRKVAPLHEDRVGQAGFVVLKSPVPSVLIETAFISNPSDERKLRNRQFQERMAEGIFAGLKRAEPWLLARRGVPVNTAHAQADTHEYVVRPGDTLAAIAREHDVEVGALRVANNLKDDNLSVGLKLRIPDRGGNS